AGVDPVRDRPPRSQGDRLGADRLAKAAKGPHRIRLRDEPVPAGHAGGEGPDEEGLAREGRRSVGPCPGPHPPPDPAPRPEGANLGVVVGETGGGQAAPDGVIEAQTVLGPMWVEEEAGVLTSSLLEEGIWDPITSRLMEVVLAPGMTFVDVGAN